MSFQSVLLLLFSFLFSILGGLIALNAKTKEESDLGLVILGLFGISFITFTFFEFRKRIFLRQIQENALTISIEGGRKFPVQKNKLYIISIILFLFGGFLFSFVKINFFYTVFSLIMTGFGFIYFFGILFGVFAKEYLVFEFDGIRMGYKNYSYIVRWDNIKQISINEWHNNLTVFLNLINPEDITRYLYVSKGRRDNTIKKIYSKIGKNSQSAKTHLLILPERYGLDSAYFYRIIDGFLKYPERRSELKINQRPN